MTVQILSDSGCDLPQDLIRANEIEVIPLLVQLDGKELIDGEDISPAQVYEAIREGKVPRTAQTPVEVFKRVFQKFVDLGKSCIYFAFSSKMSGTCQTGMMVAQHLNEHNGADIEVVDTQCGSMGQGLLVLEAAKMAKAGNTKDQIVARIKQICGHMEHVFTVDDLEYLYRGGRVSRTSAFVGSLLKIKPVLHVKNGRMIPFEKVRGKNKAIKRLVQIMGERCHPTLKQTIAISHADDIEAAHKLKQLIEEAFGHKDVIINVVGSVLGCHIGLGGVAVFFLNNSVQTT